MAAKKKVSRKLKKAKALQHTKPLKALEKVWSQWLSRSHLINGFRQGTASAVPKS